MNPIHCAAVKLAFMGGVFLALAVFPAASDAAEQTVNLQMVDDRKAVIATVEPVHELLARARISGTITALSVKEGDRVSAGDRIAVIVDEKLQLQMQALQSRIQAQQANRDEAQITFERVEKLRASGTSSQAQFDQARTTLDVAQRTLQALLTDRQVIQEQAAQGAVLAPGAGRVLKVPVSEGSVAMPGETLATIAADNYILRLQLPERHAQFMKAGDTILIGARGLRAREEPETLRRGSVVLVYPQIDQGRVIADVRVESLGDYFVGERTRVYVSTGTRKALVIPEAYLYRRFGVSYVKLKDGTEVAVQPGLPVEGGLEILAGLHEGDVVIMP
ncbi:MAG TPA: efflux RND transporter periplasmic adaptor subunit [Methylocella sp.]|nr:efflux RND transporter periplasmic adaptor subunit [Methylocella sp.]